MLAVDLVRRGAADAVGQLDVGDVQQLAARLEGRDELDVLLRDDVGPTPAARSAVIRVL